MMTQYLKIGVSLVPDPSLGYEKCYNEIEWEKIDVSENYAFECIERNLEKKDKTALIWIDEQGYYKRYTFGDLSILSNKLANVLDSLGIKKGDRVCTLLPKIPEMYISMLAIWKVGAICVPLFTAFGKNEVMYRIKDSGAKLAITDQINKFKIDMNELKNFHLIVVNKHEEEYHKDEIDFWKVIESSSPHYDIVETNENDPITICYTSGTTGPSKGTVIHRGGVRWLYPWIVYSLLPVNKDSITFNAGDPAWTFGMFTAGTANWLMGRTMLVYNGKFDVKIWLKIIQDYQVDVLACSPTALRMIIAQPNLIEKYNLSNLDRIVVAGEIIAAESLILAQKLFKCPVLDCYGLTEAGMIINNYINFPDFKIKFGETVASVGKPLPRFEVKIIDEEGKPSNKGELAIKLSPWHFACNYWMNSEEWKKRITEDGYFRTGDLAYCDEEGYFYIIGRVDDLIKTSAYRIGPAEVESAILKHPAVQLAAVIGKPDPIRGQIIKAYIVLKQGYEASQQLANEIQNFVKNNYSKVTYPREIEFVDNIPVTETGKIMRRLLRTKY